LAERPTQEGSSRPIYSLSFTQECTKACAVCSGTVHMNLIAPFGFYGCGNIGDESTLQGFARLISRYHNGTRLWVASRNPAHTRRVEPSFKYFKAGGRDPRWLWAKYRSRAYVIPGGTPIMDVLGEWPLSELAPLIRSARDHGRPVIFVGTGTEKLLRDESKRIVADVISPSVLHWSVRCERDKARLTEYGVPEEKITVAADLAWMLEGVPLTYGRKYLSKLNVNLDSRLVGVNINNEKFIHEKEPQFFEKLAGFLDSIIERFDYRILFLCNEVREDESFDKFASQKVLSFMNCRDKTFLVPNNYWAPQDMLSLIGCCSLTISTRYHFCLFSALQNIPFIAIKRSDKVDDLCWDMNWSYSVSLGDLSVSNLFDMASEIEERKEFVAEQLEKKVQLIRKKVNNNNIPLYTLMKKVKI
jgi:polysaccharide pyruvyl transferase WcaK-like protein